MGRRAALLTCVVLALAASAGTGGFTVVSADRDVSVIAAGDDRAMPSVDVHDHELRNGLHRDVKLATVTNTFPTTISSLDVEVTSETMIPPKPTHVGPPEPSAPLRAGEQADVQAAVTCGATGRTEQFTIEISVLTQSGTSVELTRAATVECNGKPNLGESGRGNGGAEERGNDKAGSHDKNGNQGHGKAGDRGTEVGSPTP